MGRDDMEMGMLRTEKDYTDALKMFQEMANITVTGKFDQETKDMMNMPRCGMPDHMGYSNSARRKRYAALASWDRNDLTWRINSVTQDLDSAEINRIMAAALKVWSDVSQLTFEESAAANADFIIDFAEGEHGDGNAFDGPSGVLAHAYFPTSNPIGGDAHFDDAELYTDGTSRGINLFQVAAHEFGHSLGLGHSDDSDALMAPFYRGYIADFELHPDDIAGIQSLYGENSGAPENTMRPFTNPPITDEGNGNPVPSCPGQLDTITSTADGKVYAFRGSLVYEIEPTGVVDGYPQQISAVFNGLPNDLDAAFFYRNGRTYFYKGDQYWRFSGTTADAGYPRPITDWNGLPADIDAAFVWSGNGRIYFTKGDQYYRFNTRYGRIDDGYPRPLSVWGLPVDSVNAATQWSYNAATYFFSEDVYYRYNDAEFEPAEGYPRPTAYWWFGCGTGELQAGQTTMYPNGAVSMAVPSVFALALSTVVAYLNLQ